MAPLRDTTRD